MGRRTEIRAAVAPRYWHAGVYVLISVFVFAAADAVYMNKYAKLPSLGDIWWLVLAIPLFCGAAVTCGCGGAALWRRIVAAAVTGALVGVFAAVAAAILGRNGETATSGLFSLCAMQTFVSAVLATIGAIVTELGLADPDLKS